MKQFLQANIQVYSLKPVHNWNTLFEKSLIKNAVYCIDRRHCDKNKIEILT